MDAKGTSFPPGNFPFPRHRSRQIVFGRLATIAVAGCLTISTANATLITFDDLPPYQDPIVCGCFEPTLVTNQYESLGIIFNTGSIWSGGPGLVSAPNVLTNAAGDIGITFTGELPTLVSMYVSAIHEDSVFIDAFGPAGYLSSVVTDGWRGSEEDSTPYRDKQLVTFKGAEMSHLSLTPVFFRRSSVHIDNLSFTREAVSIPEPSALGLVAGGLALLFGIRRRRVI